MFSKLAFKNVGRSMKDYGVWFLTIAFGVCLFYVFNSLETQAVFQYLGSGPQAPRPRPSGSSSACSPSLCGWCWPF